MNLLEIARRTPQYSATPEEVAEIVGLIAEAKRLLIVYGVLLPQHTERPPERLAAFFKQTEGIGDVSVQARGTAAGIDAGRVG